MQPSVVYRAMISPRLLNAFIIIPFYVCINVADKHHRRVACEVSAVKAFVLQSAKEAFTGSDAIDITTLNAQIEEIVAREEVLRREIAVIIAEIEGAKA